jgi:hypothetical protein
LYFSADESVLESIRARVFWDVDPKSLPVVGIDRGPSGQSGHLLLGPGQHRVFGFAKDEQEWRDCGEFWLGWDKQRLPTPEELQRERVVPGETVKLADGLEWVCPVIRRPVEGCYLPGVPAVLQKFGSTYQTKVNPRYLDVWNDSGKAWDRFFSKSIKLSEMLDHSVNFLSTNYRIEVASASALEIFDADAMESVLSIGLGLHDIDEVDALLKKKTGNG